MHLKRAAVLVVALQLSALLAFFGSFEAADGTSKGPAVAAGSSPALLRAAPDTRQRNVDTRLAGGAGDGATSAPLGGTNRRDNYGGSGNSDGADTGVRLTPNCTAPASPCHTAPAPPPVDPAGPPFWVGAAGLRACSAGGGEAGPPAPSGAGAADVRRRVERAVATGALDEAQRLLRTVCVWDDRTEWRGLGGVLASGAVPAAFACALPAGTRFAATATGGNLPYFDTLRHPVLVPTERGRTVAEVGHTRYFRLEKTKPKGNWVALSNVCLTCEDPLDPWMAPRSGCRTTVWSAGAGEIKELAARHRRGRPSIYKERQSGFQYGGVLSEGRHAGVRAVEWHGGTVVVASPFSNANVGHVLHDALFAWVAFLVSMDDVHGRLTPLPHPRRVAVEPDFFASSSRTHSTLSTLAALHVSGGTPPSVLRLPAGGSGVACFEKLVFVGGDREMRGSGVPAGSRAAATKALRSAVFARMPQAPPQAGAGGGKAGVRVFVYGRHDVHRRSIVNFGALVATVSETLQSLSVPEAEVIADMHLHPLAQAELFSRIDLLVTVQGAHMQSSIFMPPHGGVIELSPCRARKTSFLHRYGVMMPTQNHIQLEVCFPSLNLGDDKYAQNLTLCHNHMKGVATMVTQEVHRIQSVHS